MSRVMPAEWGVPIISNPWLYLGGFYFGNAMLKDVIQHKDTGKKSLKKIIFFLRLNVYAMGITKNDARYFKTQNAHSCKCFIFHKFLCSIMGPANTLDICYPIIYGGKQFVCD
jgi:hypothetical protein